MKARKKITAACETVAVAPQVYRFVHRLLIQRPGLEADRFVAMLMREGADVRACRHGRLISVFVEHDGGCCSQELWFKTVAGLWSDAEFELTLDLSVTSCKQWQLELCSHEQSERQAIVISCQVPRKPPKAHE